MGAALRRTLRGTPVSVEAVRYGGEDKGAPCWVWNKLAAKACAEGAHYFYQLNDDLMLLTPGWALRFVTALRSSRSAERLEPRGQRTSHFWSAPDACVPHAAATARPTLASPARSTSTTRS